MSGIFPASEYFLIKLFVPPSVCLVFCMCLKLKPRFENIPSPILSIVSVSSTLVHSFFLLKTLAAHHRVPAKAGEGGRARKGRWGGKRASVTIPGVQESLTGNVTGITSVLLPSVQQPLHLSRTPTTRVLESGNIWGSRKKR